MCAKIESNQLTHGRVEDTMTKSKDRASYMAMRRCVCDTMQVLSVSRWPQSRVDTLFTGSSEWSELLTHNNEENVWRAEFSISLFFLCLLRFPSFIESNFSGNAVLFFSVFSWMHPVISAKSKPNQNRYFIRLILFFIRMELFNSTQKEQKNNY